MDKDFGDDIEILDFDPETNEEEVANEEEAIVEELTEDETEKIFATNSFISKSSDAIKLDDLIEMRNYFKLFDYIIDIMDEELTKENIKEKYDW